MQTDVDVLVVGAGACGLVAAIAAHDAGVGVAIIEKLDRPGGNSSLSTGSVPAAGTRFQREAGIADSTEQFVADLLRTGGAADCGDLLRSMVATSADMDQSACRFCGRPHGAGDRLQACRLFSAMLHAPVVRAAARI
jgi:fumarate reductase flavoprotein subunit